MTLPMFVNPERALDDLPSADEVEWNPLAPHFVRCRQVRGIVRTLVLFVVIGIAHVVVANVPKVAGAAWLFLWLWLLAVPRLAWALLWPVVDIPRRGYAVRDKDILYKAGVFWRSETVVPFNRVQHAQTGNAPMERRFGLANLTVFTAGTAGGDLRIDGLDEDTAERLRVFVVGKIRDEEPRPSVADGGEVDGNGRAT